MRGFVLLRSETRGEAWVRLTHITAVSHLRYREGSAPDLERHAISVLAGGEWWHDDEPVDGAAAEARVALLTGQRRTA